jgi:hypothetical protein
MIQRPMKGRPHALPVLEVDVHTGMGEHHPDILDRCVVRRCARQMEHRASKPVPSIDINRTVTVVLNYLRHGVHPTGLGP